MMLAARFFLQGDFEIEYLVLHSNALKKATRLARARTLPHQPDTLSYGPVTPGKPDA